MNIYKRYYRRQENIILKKEENWKDWKIDKYAGKRYYPSVDANQLIEDLINGDEPFFIGRIGETEIRVLSYYSLKNVSIREFKIASCGVCENAGFFPKNVFSIKKFTNVYYKAMKQMDYLGICLWNNEELFMEKSKELKGGFNARDLDVLYNSNPWTKALKGKKVLVISPFTNTISSQYREKRTKIFENNDNMLPEFELLTLKAIQSIGGEGAAGYTTWFEALDYMKKEIQKIDFDVALLSCGAYGLPLGAYIKELGKKAIYMGGCLQLLFGVVGKRWENLDYVKKYMNEYWVRPSDDEKNALIGKVEEGCYW